MKQIALLVMTFLIFSSINADSFGTPDNATERYAQSKIAQSAAIADGESSKPALVTSTIKEVTHLATQIKPHVKPALISILEMYLSVRPLVNPFIVSHACSLLNIKSNYRSEAIATAGLDAATYVAGIKFLERNHEIKSPTKVLVASAVIQGVGGIATKELTEFMKNKLATRYPNNKESLLTLAKKADVTTLCLAKAPVYVTAILAGKATTWADEYITHKL